MVDSPTLRRFTSSSLHHQYLLRACLLSDEPALRAWERWIELVDFEKLDSTSYAFLGLLYQNLRRQGIENAYMPRLKGIYRRTWYANQLISKQFADLLTTLSSKEIEYLVMANSSLQAYSPVCQESGYRSFSSLNLLVRSVKDPALLNVLSSQGWQHDAERSASSGFLGLYDGQGSTLQLLEQIFWGQPREAAIQQVWDDAVSGSTLGESRGKILSPTDQFMYLSKQISKRHQSFKPHWVSDAVLLLRQSPLDWDRLIRQAQQYKLVIPVRNMLAIAQPYLTNEVPTEVEEQLSHLRVTRWELIQYKIFFEQKSLILRSYVARFFGVLRT